MKRISASVRFTRTSAFIFSLILCLYGCVASTANERQDSLVAEILSGNKQQSERSTVMAMRSGRAIAMPKPKTDSELLDDITPPDLSSSWLSYRKPPKFEMTQAKKWHYFGFEVTPDFAIERGRFRGRLARGTGCFEKQGLLSFGLRSIYTGWIAWC